MEIQFPDHTIAARLMELSTKAKKKMASSMRA
jgi:hypothetical protein